MKMNVQLISPEAIFDEFIEIIEKRFELEGELEKESKLVDLIKKHDDWFLVGLSVFDYLESKNIPYKDFDIISLSDSFNTIEDIVVCIQNKMN
jgi:hypothetical protein